MIVQSTIYFDEGGIRCRKYEILLQSCGNEILYLKNYTLHDKKLRNTSGIRFIKIA